MKKCMKCGKEIHPKRLEILPSATRCVACSTTSRKAGVTVVKGEGDHTYNDIVIMDREEFNKYQEVEFKTYGKRKDDITPGEEEENNNDNTEDLSPDMDVEELK